LGASVGLGVVGDSRRVGGIFVSEAVLGVTVSDELPAGASGIHFFDEGGDLRHRDVGIQGSVADEHLLRVRRRIQS